ncbi:MAG TPA: hypothetical protein VIV12_11175, partial [Streptosporangiaceae bacterium]
DLTKAHAAVRRAQAQLAALEPLLADCDTHDRLGADIEHFTRQRAALPFFFAQRKAAFLDRHIASLEAVLAERQESLKALKAYLEELREKEKRLTVERAGHGGDRLSEIERRISEDNEACQTRMEKAERFAELAAKTGMAPVETAEQFAARRREIAAAADAANQARADCENRLAEVAVDTKRLTDQADELNAELLSLRSRKSSIPKRSLDLRQWLCRELSLTEADLPFAGELIQVRAGESAWEGAAERLLHGFALSILVRDAHYPAVSDWINDHHLGARVVYYRVPATLGLMRGPVPDSAGNLLSAKLDIKDTEFFPWLERELAIRAGLACVETMAEFRRAAKAITKAGQIKGAGGRHEKNDISRIDDRSSYVLGWTNEGKINALLKRASTVQQQLNRVAADRQRHKAALDAAVERGNVVAGLAETRDFTEIDWQTLVNRIEDLKREKERLEKASGELERLNRELDAVRKDIAADDSRQGQINNAIGGLNSEITAAVQRLAEAREVLADPASEPASELFTAIAEGLAVPPLSALALTTPADLDRAAGAFREELTSLIEKRSRSQNSLGTRIASKMAEFRRQYPVETADFDDSVESASGYRELHKRLVHDDLPRFQEQFKKYLNTNTIRDIAGFQSQLAKQADLIKGRVATINASLVGVDYNTDRYIRLDAQPTPNTEIRDFRQELRAC